MYYEDEIDQIAENLYFIAQAGITQSIDFIEQVCKEIDKNHPRFSEDKRNEIGLELLLFFIHITDRMVVTKLGENRTWELMEKQEATLVSHMMGTVAGDIPQKAKKKLETYFKLKFHKRQSEYGKYKFFGKEDENPKGTLCWEFGKRVSVLAGHPTDIRFIMTAYAMSEPFIKVTNQWLKDNLK